MMEGSLAIERVELGYQAATSFDRSGRISARISEAIARSLPDALAAATQRDVDGDDRYIFIDRIDVKSSVAAHWSDDRIAGQLAQRIAHALSRQLDAGGALIFRDRTEFVAAFAASVINDGTSRRWWFDEFGGLMALPVSMQLRTLILGEGALGFAALARLSRPHLHRLVTAIEPADLTLLLDALPDEPGPPAAARRLLDAVDPGDGAALPTAQHAELALLVHLVQTGGGRANQRNRAALRVMLALFQAARAGLLPPSSSDPAITLRRWIDAVSDDGDEALALLPDEPDQLVEGITGHQSSATDDPIAAHEAPELFDFTRFGGALLLCVVLVRTGWWQIWQVALGRARPQEEAASLAATIALGVIARALDPQSVAAIEGCSPLRRAIGPDDWRANPLSFADRRLLAKALGDTDPVARRGLEGRLRAHARALIAAFADRVPGCEGSSAAYVQSQLLSLPASVSADGSQARLGRPPLDVLLTFSGLKRASVELPHGRLLSLSAEMLP